MAMLGNTVTAHTDYRQRKLVQAMAMAVLLLHTGAVVAAEDNGASSESKSNKSLWINPGLYSVHFDDDKHFNGKNWGLGVEYRYSNTMSVAAGEFENSDWKTSHYISWYWQPVSAGAIKLGATLGALDGYPNYKDGGWFLALIPAATYEGKRFGLNVLAVPGYKDRLHAAVSFQLKLRVW